MNNNFRVSFYLAGKSKAKKDGARPILYRIHLGRERLDMGATGYAVEQSNWATKANRVYGKSGNAKFINKELETKESVLRYIYRKYEFSDKLSLDLIRSEYLHQGDEEVQTFMQFFDEYIQKRTEDVGHGLSAESLQKYKVTRRRFVEYLDMKLKRKDLKFTELEYPVISGFEHYLRTENMMVHNSAIRMLKTFKTVILEATREGLITRDPFGGMKMHLEPVDRGFLTDEELERMMSYKFSIKRLEQVRDFFIFSCFTGLAYIDLANLTTDKIVEMNGRKWIISRRKKTNVSCNVPLLDVPLKIIEKYKGQGKDNHVLPVISNQKSNGYLKEIAAVCGIDKNLTCHLARHTFATMALSKDVPVESVSKMLGHTNIRTTQIYARITSKKVEADMKALAEKLAIFDGKMANMGEKGKVQPPIYNESSAVDPTSQPVKYDTTVEVQATPTKKRGRPRKQPVETSLPVVEQRAATTKEIPVDIPDEVPAPAKKRGRPRKVTGQVAPAVEDVVVAPAKKRGRPRKQVLEQTSPATEKEATSTVYTKGRKIAAQDPPKAERQRAASVAKAKRATNSRRRK